MRKLVAVLLLIVMLISSLCVNAEEVVWICNKCGAENTRYFCTRCGTKRHDDEIICKGCGEIYPADTEDIYCGNCGTKLKTNEYFSKYEGNGFETPEDAALCYLCGLKNLNLQQMLSAFAWETQVDRFDFKSMLTRIGSISSVSVPGMPVANNLLRSANIEQVRNNQIEKISRALEFFINDELYNMPRASLPFSESGNDIEDYLSRCDNGKIDCLREMGNIRLFDVNEVTDGRFSSEIMHKNFLAQNARFGADEIRVLLLAVDVGEEKYAIAPTLARYGEKWYIVDLYSIITAYLGIENNRTAFFVLPDELKENTSLSLSLDSQMYDDKRQYEREGFNSPEEAVEYYIDGLKNGNVQQMMEAFAWETQAERYSLVDYSRWYGSISYNSPIRMQVGNAFVKKLNIETLRCLQSKRIYTAIRNYVLEDEVQVKRLTEEGLILVLQKEDEIESFIKFFNNDKVDKLKRLGRVHLYDPAPLVKNYDSDYMREKMDALNGIYGADEIKETLVTADLDGDTLVFNPVLARYGGRWYIVSIEGSAFGALGIGVNKQAFVIIKGDLDLLLRLYQY